MRKFLNLTLLVLSLSISSCSAKKVKDFNILDYGAVNDSLVMSTVAIQKAIDACAANKGGGRVVVPAGYYQIGSLTLKSNVEFHVSEGAELLGSRSLDDYESRARIAVEAPEFNKTLLYAENADNVKITGKGIINGRSSRTTFPIQISKGVKGERPMMLRFSWCTNTEFRDITFKNSGSWCLHILDCDDTLITGITIDSHVNRNNDGLDIDGCKNMIVENCNIRTGDDALCPKSTTTRITENITFRNNRVQSGTAAFKCGTSTRGGFKNIKCYDSDFSGTRMGLIKLMIVDGGIMDGIEVYNIKADSCEGPIFIRLADRGRPYDKPKTQVLGKNAKHEGVPCGSVQNIVIRDIKAKVTGNQPLKQAVFISGIPGHYVENVLIENVDIEFEGGLKKGDWVTEVPENLHRYPGPTFFGILPAWGAYIRHAKNIEFKNVNISVRNADERERIIASDDVINFRETK